MDSFEPCNLIDARIGEFSAEVAPLEEIESFYSLDRVKEPALRPYVWSNTICSLDGVVSVGQGHSGVKLVGLKGYPQARTRTDFRLLAAGWAYADAIVFSAASCRAEPEQQLTIPIADLRRFRIEKLKKASENPDVVVVTSSGWLDTKHPVWKTKRRKLVATSKLGLEKLMANLKQQLDPEGTSNGVARWLEQENVTVKAFESSEGESDVNFVEMCRYLKVEWNINTMDVSAGPTLISLMVKAKVMDEYRYTTSGILAGKRPTGGEGIEEPDERPESFPSAVNDYPIHKSPILEFVGLRMFGPFHVYHRGRWIYRH